MFRQAKWSESLLFELSKESKETFSVGEEFKEYYQEALSKIPEPLLRKSKPNIPDLSEIEVVRHYTRLSQMAYGVDQGPVPLGSCTMKYNPKINEELASRDELVNLHPYLEEDDVQGLLEIMYLLQEWLARLTGTDACSLQPPAGAAGELVGALIIKKYLQEAGYGNKNEMIVPESAHGTNPASAVMAGFKVVRIPADKDGNTDLEAIKAVVGDSTAGIMLTNPSTLGLFESRIVEIAELIHKANGLLYYDGANLNGILGIVRPGDMGFDIVHLNLHKTFSTPHGGGGPGGGAVCVKKHLLNYLPVPLVVKENGKYRFKYDLPNTIGRISWFYGNIIPIVKAFLYIATLGPNIREVAEISVLNTNYFMKRMSSLKGVSLQYGEGRWRKHEVVLSFDRLHKETGVSAEDVAKALLDRGFHAPTIYFPLIVSEAHMVELTETESKENIDAMINAYSEILQQAYEDPEKVKKTPLNTSVHRLDVLVGNHPKTYAPTYKYLDRVRSLLKNKK